MTIVNGAEPGSPYGGPKGIGVQTEGGNVTITGEEDGSAIDVTATYNAIGIEARARNEATSSSVTVENGDVTVKGGRATGISAEPTGSPDSGHSTEITIENGDLNVSGEKEAIGVGIYQFDSVDITASSINVTCDADTVEFVTGISAWETSATVKADVNVSCDSEDAYVGGVAAYDAELTLDGSLSVEGNEGATAVFAAEGAVLITGDVEIDNGMAILSTGGSTVAILGELEGGVIATDGTEGTKIVLGSAALNEDGVYPVILIDDEGSPVEATEEQLEQLNSQVYFIVDTKDTKIEISGTEAFVALNDETYQIANLGTTITVTPTGTKKVQSMKLYADAEKTVEIETIMNEDGSCTLVWPTDKVDFHAITAVLTYLQASNPNRKVTVKTTSEKADPEKEDSGKDSIGDKVRFGGEDWIITDISEETGLYTLASVASFTEEQLEDMQGLLDELLTDDALAYVQKDEAQQPIVSLIDEEVAARYFGGETNHLRIETDPAFPRG